MAEIEEMNLESNKTDEMKAENRVWLTKVVFSGGESITVSGNDIAIIDRFIDAGNELEKLVEEMEKKESEVGENDYKKEIEIHREFSDRATEIMDNVFGEGTTKKFFEDVYAVIPNFQPDVECFMDFWDALIPVVERLSEHKVKLEKLASKQRMAKYQPRDYKRPSAKR